MRAFTRQGDEFVAEFEDIETALLTDLVGQVGALLDGIKGGMVPVSDEAALRLFPDAYENDDEAAEEFRRFTQDDLIDRKLDDAFEVLSSFERIGAFPPVEGQPVTIRLSQEQAVQWIRTLTDLRLTLDTRINQPRETLAAELTEDDIEHFRNVFDWLAFVQGTLVEALDDEL